MTVFTQIVNYPEIGFKKDKKFSAKKDSFFLHEIRYSEGKNKIRSEGVFRTLFAPS